MASTTARSRGSKASLAGLGRWARPKAAAVGSLGTLEGKRVLALVMAAIVPDLEGLELVGAPAEAVLVGGCDETLEPNQVFSYMNLGRAFTELQAGADLYCLHKNKWWQTARGPMLDAGSFVAGLEYATGVEATVLEHPVSGRPLAMAAG